MITQSNNNSCWLACAAMVRGYRENHRYTENEIASILGEPFLGYFSHTQSLPADMKVQFASRMGLQIVNASVALSPSYLRNILERSQNPIIVTIGGYTNGSYENIGFHAVLVIGINGDGNPESNTTIVQIIDPANGQVRNIPYPDFADMYNLGVDEDTRTNTLRPRFMYYSN